MNDTPKIVSDQPGLEAFIPVAWSKTLEAALRPSAWVEEWRKSPAGQRAAAVAEQHRQEAAVERQRVLARHAELVATETHPVLAALLKDHAPTEVHGQLVCRTCPPRADPFGDEDPASAPCMTWARIAGGA